MYGSNCSWWIFCPRPCISFEIVRNYSIQNGYSSEEDINNLFEYLHKYGKVPLPLKEEFWGAIFGSIED